MSDLHSRRMLALQLDQDEIARLDPITFGELQWLCVLCEDRDRCEASLADDFVDVAWRGLLSERRHADCARRIALVSNCSGLIAGAGGGWAETLAAACSLPRVRGVGEGGKQQNSSLQFMRGIVSPSSKIFSSVG